MSVDRGKPPRDRRVAWVLWAYNKKTELAEHDDELHELTNDVVRRILAIPADVPLRGEFPVSPDQLPDLQPYLRASLDVDRYNYHLCITWVGYGPSQPIPDDDWL
jgi:hypothetical protein